MFDACPPLSVYLKFEACTSTEMATDAFGAVPLNAPANTRIGSPATGTGLFIASRMAGELALAGSGFSAGAFPRAAA